MHITEWVAPNQSIKSQDAFTIGNDHILGNLPEDVQRAIDSFNYKYCKAGGKEEFFNGIYSSLSRSKNPPYAMFSQRGDSETTVSISQTPFGTGLTPRNELGTVLGFLGEQDVDEAAKKLKFINSNALNTLVKTALLDHINRESGVVDGEGNHIPIIVAAGTGVEYSPNLSLLEYCQVFTGNFEPYAKRVLEIVQRLGKKAILPYGYSRGATVASEMLELAPQMDMDVLGAVLVEGPNYRKRFLPSFMLGYFGDFEKGKKPEDINGDWLDNGPAPILDIQHGSGAWIDNLLKHPLDTAMSARGMSKGARYLKNVKAAARNTNATFVVGYGEASGVTGSDFEKVLEHDADLASFAYTAAVKVLVARGMAPHSFGENHVAHAAFFNQGFKLVLNHNNQ